MGRHCFLLALAAIIAPTITADDIHPVCNLCPAGEVFGSPDAAPIPGAPETTCADLQTLGTEGSIPEAMCESLKEMVNDCECKVVETATIIEEENYPVCNLCPAGEIFGSPDAAPIRGAPETTCTELQKLGTEGSIPEAMCESLKDMVDDCECKVVETEDFTVIEAQSSCQVCENPAHSLLGDEHDPFSTCYSLWEVSQHDDIPDNVCDELREYVAAFDCHCEAQGFGAAEVTPSPTSAPTVTPFIEGAHAVCNLCGEGKIMGAPDGRPIPAAFNTKCSDLQKRGSNGRIPEGICEGLQDIFQKPCSCQEGAFGKGSCVTLLMPCTKDDTCCQEGAVCEGICIYPQKDTAAFSEAETSSKLYNEDSFASQSLQGGRGGIRRRLRGH